MATKRKQSKTQPTKTKPTKVSVADYIRAVPNETRQRDARAVLAIMRKVTGLPPKMWGPSIIGFGSRHYRYESGHEGDTPMAAFSPRSSALVVYLGCDGEERPLLQQLGKHKMGKGCLYINKLADVDTGILQRLIELSYERAQVQPSTTN
jgi:Domain of unknown function (DU1801)